MNQDDTKYQVFVSSTYQDLIPERQEIMHALLELDCIPSGMELFPAADDDQWSLIKGVIDDCDYYVVVIAGRYGSVDSAGISYTEKEYRYALETGKPVMAFLHKSPGSLAADLSEKTELGRNRLESFRELAQRKMCKFWETKQELGSVVSRSLVKLQRSHPGVGWVRGDRLPSKNTTLELLNLRKNVEELEVALSKARTESPKGTEDLAQGEDLFELTCSFDTTGPNRDTWEWTRTFEVSWNDIFAEVSPAILHEMKTDVMRGRLNGLLRKRVLVAAAADDELKGHTQVRDVAVEERDLETVLVQLISLGLMTKSDKPRSVRDHFNYWMLTPYGQTVMYRLRAVRRPG